MSADSIVEEALFESFKTIWRNYTYPDDLEMMKKIDANFVAPTFDEHFEKHGLPAWEKAKREILHGK